MCFITRKSSLLISSSPASSLLLSQSTGDQDYEYFQVKVRPLLEVVYPDDESLVNSLLTQIYALIQEETKGRIFRENLETKWRESDSLLITYGNSVKKEGETPLDTLRDFLKKYLKGTISGVHILPFFPYSSDDGFSVIDYCKVNPELGDWNHVAEIGEDFDLMMDLVCNHMSSESEWFIQFKEGEAPGCNYFVTVEDPSSVDLSSVVRPRASPLLTRVDTVDGPKYVWTTFSADQVDLDFQNPDVLLEFIKIILFYQKNNAKYIRLDAVGFLWKKIGTSCMHLPQTHAIVQLMRQVMTMADPKSIIITETNVPQRENLSYFGNRNEAHMVYNFSLPPLILHAMIQGTSEYLKHWMMGTPPAPHGCAYFNFTASHDGIGLRPAEGLLSDREFNSLLDTMKKFGGKISMRKKPDGSEGPYECNIAFFDAMKGTHKGEDEWQIDRFICSQTIMMSLEGIPAFYIHSLLATPNDYKKYQETGRNRSVNRHEWDIEELEAKLSDPESPQSIVLGELCHRIRIRRKQIAFHPDSIQFTLHLKRELLGFWRQDTHRSQNIFCIFNLTTEPQTLELSSLNLYTTSKWYDLISEEALEDIYAVVTLEPYQSIWLTNVDQPF